AGGIAVANLVGGSVNAIIDDNIVRDNRYGMTIVGPNSFAYVRNNIFEDNDTQNNPNLGGSGISLSNGNNSMEVIASGNQFRRNLWGITLLSGANINLGDGADNPGQNVFSDNGNEGAIYALYNNTDLPVMALNNCWDEANAPNTLADAEAVIVHQNDIGTLGEVSFDPVDCGFLGVGEDRLNTVNIYPNPTQGRLFLSDNTSYKRVKVYSLEGKLVAQQTLQNGDNELHFRLTSGLYLMELVGDNARAVKKLMINN